MRSLANLESDQTPRELTPSKSPAHCFPSFEDTRLSSIHPRGTVLFTEGQQARGVYLVLAGSAKVSISSAQGKVLILRIAQRGDLLGVNSTLTGKPYEATAETLKQCRTVFFPRAEFVSMHTENEDVREFVLRAFSRHVSEMIDSTRRLLLSQTAPEKFARLLLKWCDEHGVVEQGGILLVNHFTQEEIGQMICTSRETVSRLFGEFARGRIISVTSNTIVVRNREALENIGAIANTIDT
jgi:CRP/FNR family cyclic AMP-dependent transcriptional regulator